jgi:hypothetical protein
MFGDAWHARRLELISTLLAASCLTLAAEMAACLRRLQLLAFAVLGSIHHSQSFGVQRRAFLSSERRHRRCRSATVSSMPSQFVSGAVDR